MLHTYSATIVLTNLQTGRHTGRAMASVSFAPLPTGSHGFEVEGSDVMKLVLQFLHEQGLSKAAGALQAESGVALNVVDNKESFAAVRA